MAVLVLAFGSCRNSEPPKIGKTAPDFTVSDGQKTVQLSQFRGKPVLLNFWATWCPPCVQEVPDWWPCSSGWATKSPFWQ